MAVLLLPIAAQATRQSPDILIMDGTTFFIQGWKLDFPLEAFFEGRERPMYSRNAEGSIGTNCWRGYEAIWTVTDGKLILVSIDTFLGGNKQSVSDVVGESCFAEWFSGEIPVREVRYARGKYKKMVLTFDRGLLQSRPQPDASNGPGAADAPPNQ